MNKPKVDNTRRDEFECDAINSAVEIIDVV